jgi:hypothetical protein
MGIDLFTKAVGNGRNSVLSGGILGCIRVRRQTRKGVGKNELTATSFEKRQHGLAERKCRTDVDTVLRVEIFNARALPQLVESRQRCE